MKVLVYGETVREARNHYVPKAGDSVGARTYSDYGNGEECDLAIFVDESKVKKPAKSKKRFL